MAPRHKSPICFSVQRFSSRKKWQYAFDVFTFPHTLSTGGAEWAHKIVEADVAYASKTTDLVSWERERPASKTVFTSGRQV